MESPNLLSLTNLTKSFGGVAAVNDVSFDVERGSIMGLIGPNGAGKTTVFNLITGNYHPDSGQIRFDGQDIAGMRTNRIVSLGIARTFQTIRLFQNMSALENVLAGCHCRMRSGIIAAMLRLPRQRREEREAVEIAAAELDFVGLRRHLDSAARNFSYGNQRLLEIARALATRPRFLILDEPAGGMNDYETQLLVRTISQIRDRGITVLLIEHDMNLVMKICEKITVLDHGVMIAEGNPEEIQNDRNVIDAYLGSPDNNENEGF
ncbi:MAG: ABC transporter ATP-binding protein [Syntrophales bacterium]|jgi:branched-chain amino acid transport system ATP-binding protein|nr:ABC transporter ATP-binding protein [Syntrophales bacterium]MCK9527832.1 ABC transporter ATP-binding protein [Syntrophales bacterium]MDX9922071.1 ABC transporter ATP-binding protein [Syntrophales bacterium]